MDMSQQSADVDVRPSSSNRILNIPCKVCGDFSSGKHYNIFACDGCAGFFKRTIRRNRIYICKAKDVNCCIIDKTRRNQCRACRLSKCQKVGMNRDAVQHERGPRNSTVHRLPMEFRASPAMMPILNVSSQMMQGPYNIANNFVNGISCANYAGLLQPISNSLTLTPAAQPEPSISELAARLLFMNVKWIKSIASFTTLLVEDQHALLESSWKELFVIGASLYLNVDFSKLVQSLDMSKRDKEQAVELLKGVGTFQNAINEIANLRMDPHEYAYLRGICLYRVRDEEQQNRFANKNQIIEICNHSYLSFQIYIRSTYPYQLNRFNVIMDLLQSMQKVQSSLIEDLFFRDTIGQITIERIIIDMYKSQ